MSFKLLFWKIKSKNEHYRQLSEVKDDMKVAVFSQDKQYCLKSRAVT